MHYKGLKSRSLVRLFHLCGVEFILCQPILLLLLCLFLYTTYADINLHLSMNCSFLLDGVFDLLPCLNTYVCEHPCYTSVCHSLKLFHNYIVHYKSGCLTLVVEMHGMVMPGSTGKRILERELFTKSNTPPHRPFTLPYLPLA